jgi:hypothetical protein
MTALDAYKQYYSSRSGYTYPTATKPIVDGSDVKLYNYVADKKAATNYDALASNLLGNYIPGNTSTGGTGVMRAPYIDPLTAALLSSGWDGRRIGGFGDSQRTETPGPSINWDAIFSSVGDPYSRLQSQLGQTVESERRRIDSGANVAANSLQTTDPMAGYRETYPSFQAPTAAASTYLGAIGANPAQVQALQDYQNQMMASQSASQQGFGQAVDASQGNWRLAQLADIYSNRQLADSQLGQQFGAQSTAIGMAKNMAEASVRQELLALQMELIKAAMSQRDGIKSGPGNDQRITLSSLLQGLGTGSFVGGL